MGGQHRLFARHPKTLFINAHLGWMDGDLGELGRPMDRLPSMQVLKKLYYKNALRVIPGIDPAPFPK